MVTAMRVIHVALVLAAAALAGCDDDGRPAPENSSPGAGAADCAGGADRDAREQCTHDAMIRNSISPTPSPGKW